MEKAFIISKDSKLYKTYFLQHAEEEKLHESAKEFFEKHDLINDNGKYSRSKRLELSLTKEQYKKYENQLMSKQDRDLYCFKLKSPMNVEWENEVWDKVDSKNLNCNRMWYWDYFSKGKYRMFHIGDILLTWINSDGEINITEEFVEIKLSEYHKMIEEYEAVSINV